jgi:hypothetical protein
MCSQDDMLTQQIPIRLSFLQILSLKEVEFYTWIKKKVLGQLIPRGDEYYETVSINFNFTYYDTYHTQLTMSTNGFVCFGFVCVLTATASSGNAISALNYNLDTRFGGGIYYQYLNSQSSDFNSIKSDLNRLNSNFVPTNLFRISYDNVPNYLSSLWSGSLRASFQIVLASDGTKSYILLKYTSCLSDVTLFSTPGLYYLSNQLNGQQMSNQFSNPCSSSNVNIGGTWVFDVSPSISKFEIYFLTFGFISK